MLLEGAPGDQLAQTGMVCFRKKGMLSGELHNLGSDWFLRSLIMAVSGCRHILSCFVNSDRLSDTAQFQCSWAVCIIDKSYMDGFYIKSKAEFRFLNWQTEPEFDRLLPHVHPKLKCDYICTRNNTKTPRGVKFKSGLSDTHFNLKFRKLFVWEYYP